jgi:hypothetical protein
LNHKVPKTVSAAHPAVGHCPLRFLGEQAEVKGALLRLLWLEHGRSGGRLNVMPGIAARRII